MKLTSSIALVKKSATSCHTLAQICSNWSLSLSNLSFELLLKHLKHDQLQPRHLKHLETTFATVSLEASELSVLEINEWLDKPDSQCMAIPLCNEIIDFETYRDVIWDRIDRGPWLLVSRVGLVGRDSVLNLISVEWAQQFQSWSISCVASEATADSWEKKTKTKKKNTAEQHSDDVHCGSCSMTLLLGGPQSQRFETWHSYDCSEKL